jgi:hypothetical protein
MLSGSSARAGPCGTRSTGCPTAARFRGRSRRRGRSAAARRSDISPSGWLRTGCATSSTRRGAGRCRGWCELPRRSRMLPLSGCATSSTAAAASPRRCGATGRPERPPAAGLRLDCGLRVHDRGGVRLAMRIDTDYDHHFPPLQWWLTDRIAGGQHSLWTSSHVPIRSRRQPLKAAGDTTGRRSARKSGQRRVGSARRQPRDKPTSRTDPAARNQVLTEAKRR